MIPSSTTTLRKRNISTKNGSSSQHYNTNNPYDDDDDKKITMRRAVKKLDMFPKIDRDLTVQTDRGGLMTLIGYGVIGFLILCELGGWYSQNQESVERLVVDTSLGKKMKVNFNISFPGLHCDDLHLDVMDVAGDSQLNIDDDTLVKRRLHLDGTFMDEEEIRDKANKAKDDHDKREALVKEMNKPNYCGPCYGAGEQPTDCCQTCDEVRAAYKKKKWGTSSLTVVAEQCIREGIHFGPKLMSRGEGCNLAGSLSLNRVNGNFHVAMGDGVERNGHHIHLFNPEDRENFNASHVIHELSFGPMVSEGEVGPLDGVSKITTVEVGETGLFQYFIKIVPTIYKKGRAVEETNRFFVTERFRPLVDVDTLDEEHYEMGKDHLKPDYVVSEDNNDDDADDVKARAGAKVGGATGGTHHQKHHHTHLNAILPGVFFVYEIYPFAVEVTKNSVSLTHLVIRVMALFGGVFTIVGWIDSFLCARGEGLKNKMYNVM